MVKFVKYVKYEKKTGKLEPPWSREVLEQS